MRCVVRFCHYLGKSAQETIDIMKEAYMKDCLDESMIFRWLKVFSKGRESAKLISPPGSPVSAPNEVNVNTILALNQENRQMIEAASIMNISVGMVHLILINKLELIRVMLMSDQMLSRINACNEWKAMRRRDSTFLKRVIMCEKTWV